VVATPGDYGAVEVRQEGRPSDAHEVAKMGPLGSLVESLDDVVVRAASDGSHLRPSLLVSKDFPGLVPLGGHLLEADHVRQHAAQGSQGEVASQGGARVVPEDAAL
jgi:hypothetical protein